MENDWNVGWDSIPQIAVPVCGLCSGQCNDNDPLPLGLWS